MTSSRRLARWAAPAAAALGLSCSPFGDLARQRDADLAEIERQAPPARANELRQRVVRDALTGRMRESPYRAMLKDPNLERAIAAAPLAIADDYVRLAGALLAAGDLDGALSASEAGLDAAARVVPAQSGAPLRQEALRLQEQIWTKRREPSRAEAARVLAEVEASAPGDLVERAAKAATLIGKTPADGPLALAHGLAPDAGLDVLESLRKGKSRAKIEKSRPAPPAPPPEPPPTAETAAVPPPEPPLAPTGVEDAGAPPAPPASDVAARLKKLDELRAQKAITEKEYFRERARILKEGL